MIYDYNTLVVTEGYRLVYFYSNGNYYIGTYAKKIEDFMIEFCEFYPIIDEEDIPKFESIDDILHRCLINIKNIIEVITKYQGSYAIRNDNNEFYFSVILPN